jgi:hypothetical protein
MAQDYNDYNRFQVLSRGGHSKTSNQVTGKSLWGKAAARVRSTLEPLVRKLVWYHNGQRGYAPRAAFGRLKAAWAGTDHFARSPLGLTG